MNTNDDNTEISDATGCGIASLLIIAACIGGLGMLAAVIFTVRCAWEAGGA